MTKAGRNKRYAGIRSTFDYDPFNEQADRMGLVKVWKTYDEKTLETITFGYTKAECIRETRRLGYVVHTKETA